MTPLSGQTTDAATPDGKKYDQYATQWMREALEGRQIIEELKAQNDKLQREVYSINAKVNLIYECCGDLGVTDRVGDLMHRKLRDFQSAKVARENVSASPATADVSSPARKKMQPDSDGLICGSSIFHQVAGYASSYDAQVSRDNYRRRNVFDAEESKLREGLDIFGNPKTPTPTASPMSSPTHRGDTIDHLLSTSASSGNVNPLGRSFNSAPSTYPPIEPLGSPSSYGSPSNAYR